MKRILVIISVMASMAVALWALQAQAEWKIDLSRRQQQLRQHEIKAMNPEKKATFLQKIFAGGGATNDVVIINTEKGFVPETLRLRRGIGYTIHVVNVNDKEKNISFLLDAFSEHHATYYGQVKTFRIEPQKEGIFSYQCPETSFEGKMVVVNTDSQPFQHQIRQPASE